MNFNLPPSHLRRALGCGLLWAAMCFGFATSSLAQALRDPTIAPTTAGMAGAGEPQPEDAVKTGSVSVLKREGAYYLMIGTRLYGVGQQIGQRRIARISETEIWLREGGQLQKIQVYGGVQRSAAEPLLAPKQSAVAPFSVRPAQITP